MASPRGAHRDIEAGAVMRLLALSELRARGSAAVPASSRCPGHIVVAAGNARAGAVSAPAIA